MDSSTLTTRYAQRRSTPLRIWRAASGLSQCELASLAGVRHETVCRLELDRNEPRRSTADHLADALGVDVEELFPPKTGGAEPGA